MPADFPNTVMAQPSFADAIDAAKGLKPEAGETNTEYTRGQAELIVDMFGLSMDDHRDVIITLIT